MPRPDRASSAVFALAGRLLLGAGRPSRRGPQRQRPRRGPRPVGPAWTCRSSAPTGRSSMLSAHTQANGPTSAPSGPTWWGAARSPTCAPPTAPCHPATPRSPSPQAAGCSCVTSTPTTPYWSTASPSASWSCSAAPASASAAATCCSTATPPTPTSLDGTASTGPTRHHRRAGCLRVLPLHQGFGRVFPRWSRSPPPGRRRSRSGSLSWGGRRVQRHRAGTGSAPRCCRRPGARAAWPGETADPPCTPQSAELPAP